MAALLGSEIALKSLLSLDIMVALAGRDQWAPTPQNRYNPHMTRRSLFRFLAAPQVQSAGPTNFPRCPVCQAPVPKDAPTYLPLVANPDGTQGALANVRDQFCVNCGTRFVTNP